MLDWKGAQPPKREPIVGSRVRLEPLDDQRHAGQLFRAAHGPGADPDLWDYLGYGPFESADHFAAFVRAYEMGDDPLCFAVVDDAPRGVASYLRMEPDHGVIEIGHIWFGAGLQRTPAATEAIYLLARHAFDDLGYRRLEWKTDARNARSRRAAERFGFTFEGVFRQHMVIKGRNRDTAWYAMLDHEWPAAKAAFEAWLDPANFDREGRQKRTLADLRSS